MNDFQIYQNPDFIFRKKIEEAIKENDGYCCCSLFKDEDSKCICKDFREQNKSGFCNCGRYYKVLSAQKVFLCGRAQSQNTNFEDAVRDLVLDGYIVMTSFSKEEDFNENEQRLMTELDRTQIADCDILYVIGGYEDAKEEINWAKELNKKIMFI